MTTKDINRRGYLAALSATVGGGLAGCADQGGDGGDGETGSGDGSSGGELGERVQPVNLAVMRGIGQVSALEQVTNHVIDILGELGIQADPVTKEFTTLSSELNNDGRDQNLIVNWTPSFAEYLDPNTYFQNLVIQNAGANGRANEPNYASCDYSELVQQQTQATNPEERGELIQEAFSVLSEDIQSISLCPTVNSGAWRTDQVEMPDDLGSWGLTQANSDLFWEMSAVGDNDIVAYPTTSFDTSVTFMATPGQSEWSNLVYSPLVYYNKNLEPAGALATDWEVEDEFQTFTFSLRESAVFHNGDPITAEDVKWTFEWLDSNSDTFPTAISYPYDSIDALDEHTVQFNMTEPSPTFVNQEVPKWGILPRDIWIDGGAEENPTSVQLDEIVGSGPYQVIDFTPEEIMSMEPFDDHWFSPDANLAFRRYQDAQSAFRAFEDGDLNILFSPSPNQQDIIQNEMSDVANFEATTSFTNYAITPQHSYGPAKFREFRHALSQGLNRQLVNARFTGGNSEPFLYASDFSTSHPFYPDDHEGMTQIADSPEGSVERAHEILEEAGWGWDDDGNLHYPPDAELEAWPQGSAPCEQPDKFPCVDELC